MEPSRMGLLRGSVLSYVDQNLQPCVDKHPFDIPPKPDWRPPLPPLVSSDISLSSDLTGQVAITAMPRRANATSEEASYGSTIQSLMYWYPTVINFSGAGTRVEAQEAGLPPPQGECPRSRVQKPCSLARHSTRMRRGASQHDHACPTYFQNLPYIGIGRRLSRTRKHAALLCEM